MKGGGSQRESRKAALEIKLARKSKNFIYLKDNNRKKMNCKVRGKIASIYKGYKFTPGKNYNLVK